MGKRRPVALANPILILHTGDNKPNGPQGRTMSELSRAHALITSAPN
jgi:hypothetical protein